ncbi:Kinase D-interacting substrate of 220 kDa [Symbiodinium microadriaticum]|uniref:Kinase D-interacting substrate of 220 kDa n=1 Tax=Symbiodinium microadriaticum TaxID=2951 RepID=A0A1Q9EZI9_SYMMI|nr:Kinase D-interacting substrate of 220 kDa [Symbiodinium microadriaticum]
MSHFDEPWERWKSALEREQRWTVEDLADAAEQGSVSEVEAMMQLPQDPDLCGTRGQPALTIASMQGHVEVARLLLEAGADKNFHNGTTALMLASLQGHVEAAQLLVEANANTDLTDRNGLTALTIASGQGFVEVVRVLLEAGVDKDLAANNGATALTMASDQGNVEIVHLLLEAGAAKNLVSNVGLTALMTASGQGHVEVVRLLLEASADKNLSSRNGSTALMLASLQGHVEAAQLLVEANANTDLTDKHGLTALMIASGQGLVEVVRVLLEAGVDKDLATDSGFTALMAALGSSQAEVVRLLLDARADTNMADNNGFTALSIASGQPAGACPNSAHPSGVIALTMHLGRRLEVLHAVSGVAVELKRQLYARRLDSAMRAQEISLTQLEEVVAAAAAHQVDPASVEKARAEIDTAKQRCRDAQGAAENRLVDRADAMLWKLKKGRIRMDDWTRREGPLWDMVNAIQDAEGAQDWQAMQAAIAGWREERPGSNHEAFEDPSSPTRLFRRAQERCGELRMKEFRQEVNDILNRARNVGHLTYDLLSLFEKAMDPWADYLSRRQSRLQRDDASERATAPMASTYGTWIGSSVDGYGQLSHGHEPGWRETALLGYGTYFGTTKWTWQPTSSTTTMVDYPFNVPISTSHGIRQFYDFAGAYRTYD